MTAPPQYYPEPGPYVQELQNVLGRLDKVVSRFDLPFEGQWNDLIWIDKNVAGNEAAGTVIQQRNNVGFKARSGIAFNSSDAQFTLSGGVIFPANAGFVYLIRSITSGCLRNA